MAAIPAMALTSATLATRAGKSSQTILVAVSAPRAASSAVMMVDAKSAPMVGLQTSGMETAPGIELMLPNKYD